MYRTIITLLIALIFISCEKQTGKKFKHTNDLINETSPYLLKHAHNPVDWKPWNKKTLDLAKKENKLIIVSVGYSACHWCHVMEEESFENDTVAKIMNENFINIKVDREERPDIDKVYMSAVELMTGNAGWPLNCITLPDGRPIFGGTYFTKKQWIQVLNRLVDLYKNNPQKAIDFAEKLTKGVQDAEMIVKNDKAVSFKKEEISLAVANWKQHLDFEKGGQMGTLKFPKVNLFSFLQRYGYQNKDNEITAFVDTTLIKMARGGIYDQIGGGFSRYTVDEKWHVPHFEKMLYDNAQLVSLYANGYSMTNNDLYKQVVEETLEFVEKELLDKNGGFYSSLDADSYTTENESEEGAFYTWTESELRSLITKDYPLFKSYYNINSYGLWEEDKYVLIRNQTNASFAKKYKVSILALEEKIKRWKTILLSEREKRQKPKLDDKILTSWNGLMLKAYVDAYKAFQNPRYLEIALKNAAFITKNQLRKDGGLNRNFKDNKSTINGYAEDYATVIEGFISLYQVSLDEQWLLLAKKLTEYTIEHFYDVESNMFFFTSHEDEDLITKNIDVVDKAISSSNSIFANNLFKLSHYFSNTDYDEKAQKMLGNISKDIEKSGLAYTNWLQLMTNYTSDYFEVAVSGAKAIERIEAIQKVYIPNILVAGATKESGIPLMEGRYNESDTYIYICVNGTCKLPKTDVENVISKLLIK